jgi:hypothetical protein
MRQVHTAGVRWVLPLNDAGVRGEQLTPRAAAGAGYSGAEVRGGWCVTRDAERDSAGRALYTSGQMLEIWHENGHLLPLSEPAGAIMTRWHLILKSFSKRQIGHETWGHEGSGEHVARNAPKRPHQWHPMFTISNPSPSPSGGRPSDQSRAPFRAEGSVRRGAWSE